MGEKNFSLTPEKRYRLWQENLLKGVTYKEMQEIFAKHDSSNDDRIKVVYLDYKDTVRQDMVAIKKVLRENSIDLVETKKGKTFVFKIDKPIDLVDIYKRKKNKSPFLPIITMLSKSEDFMPNGVLEKICPEYANFIENEEVKIVSFDTDYESMTQLENFPDFYHALNKHPLKLSIHKVNRPNELQTVIFYPEYLKQYNSNWYAFGVIRVDDEDQNLKCSRVPLNTVDECVELCDNSFIHSSVQDYDDYFSDIIGVENSENREVETIYFRISNAMFNRVCQKPLHGSQHLCKQYDTKGYHGMKMNVKYNVELLRTILNLGSDIEIISPVYLRNRVKKELTKTLKMYDK